MDPQIERSRHFLTWAMDGKPNSTISLNHPQFHERRLEISLQNTTTKDFCIRRFRMPQSFVWYTQVSNGLSLNFRKRTHFFQIWGYQSPDIFHAIFTSKNTAFSNTNPLCGHAAAGEAGEAVPCGTSGTRRSRAGFDGFELSPMDFFRFKKSQKGIKRGHPMALKFLYPMIRKTCITIWLWLT